MNFKLVEIEPERQNTFLRWWSQPEQEILIRIVDQWRNLALLEASHKQSEAAGDKLNPNFVASAEMKLYDAAVYAAALKVLAMIGPDNPDAKFIQRIEI